MWILENCDLTATYEHTLSVHLLGCVLVTDSLHQGREFGVSEPVGTFLPYQYWL